MPKSEIEKIHRSIYQMMKKKALSYEGNHSQEFKKYLRDQKKLSQRPFKKSSLKRLMNQIKSSNIIYLGDFHTFGQSSKNFVRILNKILIEDKKFILGVEFIQQKYQHIVEHFLHGDITEYEFLEDIHYENSWKFPWIQYKSFFDLAKENNIPILALNSTGGLNERDISAAKKINECHKKYPNHKILVFFGELHIVNNKLPDKVYKLAKAKIKAKVKTKQSANIHDIKQLEQTIIHQNLDDLYWKLKNVTNKNQIVEFSQNEFALQTSPPWIKYESMNYWYENLSEDPDFDIHEYSIERVHNHMGETSQDNFLFIAKTIVTTLRLDVSHSDLEDFNIYGHEGLNFVIQKINTIKNTNVKNLYLILLESGKTFKIPGHNCYYCSNYSINRLAFLAGNHIFNLVLKQNSIYADDIVAKKTSNNYERFLYYFYMHFFSYLSSKIINPYRKCDLYQDFQERISKEKHLEKYKLKALALSIKILDERKIFEERKLKEHLRGVHQRVLHSTAKTLGNFMADVFHDEHLMKNTGVLSPYDLIRKISKDPINTTNFYTYLNTILPVEQYTKFKKRDF